MDLHSLSLYILTFFMILGFAAEILEDSSISWASKTIFSSLLFGALGLLWMRGGHNDFLPIVLAATTTLFVGIGMKCKKTPSKPA